VPGNNQPLRQSEEWFAGGEIADAERLWQIAQCRRRRQGPICAPSSPGRKARLADHKRDGAHSSAGAYARLSRYLFADFFKGAKPSGNRAVGNSRRKFALVGRDEHISFRRSARPDKPTTKDWLQRSYLRHGGLNEATCALISGVEGPPLPSPSPACTRDISESAPAPSRRPWTRQRWFAGRFHGPYSATR